MTFQLKTELLIDLGNWQKGLNKAAAQMGKFDRTVTGLTKGLKAGIAGVSAALLTGFVGGWIEAAEEARQANRRLDQVANSMNLFGSNLPEVTDKLKKFADELELSTGVTAEQVKQVQTTLLTFKELGKTAGVTGGLFDRTTEAALDLAATGFGTVEGNAKQLGKALQDPIKGLTSLTRSGVTFTDKERKKIKVLVESNKLAEAQGMILKAVEKQVGGNAAASASSIVKLQNAFGQITEEIGKQFLPIMDKMVEWFQSSEGKAAVQEWMDKINELGSYFASAEFGEALDTWAGRIEDLLTLIGGLLDGLNEFLGAVDAAQPENSRLLKGVDDITGNKGASDAVMDYVKVLGNPFDSDFESKRDAALDRFNDFPELATVYTDAVDDSLKALGPLEGIGRWFGEVSGQIKPSQPAPPIVNVSVSPITGRQTVDIINGFARTKGVVPGSLFN
jgi:ABC-type transporter Mla subunit MlaD